MDLDFKIPCFFNLEPKIGAIRIQWVYYWRSLVTDDNLVHDL